MRAATWVRQVRPGTTRNTPGAHRRACPTNRRGQPLMHMCTLARPHGSPERPSSQERRAKKIVRTASHGRNQWWEARSGSVGALARPQSRGAADPAREQSWQAIGRCQRDATGARMMERSEASPQEQAIAASNRELGGFCR